MMHLRKSLSLLPLVLVVLLAFPRPSYAYIDPGSGSLLLQALIGGFIGVYVTLKMRLGSWVGRVFRRSVGRTAEDVGDKPK